MVVLAERLAAGLLPSGLSTRVAALAPCVPVPLLVLTLHDMADEDSQALATSFAEACTMPEAVSDVPGHFSAVQVAALRWDASSGTASPAHSTLSNGLVWLAENAPSQPQLQVGKSAVTSES